ncbi:hypothetical protein B0H12DRAFT_351864 [Mycena haematopus]|nr:hypothetical protein B0H12DRAFT_1139986 [Mycena haematopus]KAJ7261400.1 hypothetical protein B0H12DRAFT_351864 [Mycena haematopus]
MGVLQSLKYGLKIASRLQARPGLLVYCRDQTSITRCFYELLRGQGIDVSDEELNYLPSLHTPSNRLGRPCIIVDQLPDSHLSVCFISQIKGRKFSPIGRFFGVPIDNTKKSPNVFSSGSPVDQEETSDLSHKSSPSFPPLRFTDRTGDDTRSGRFYLFAIPVARRRIHLPPGGARYLVDEDLQRTVELVRERVATCAQIHSTLRRDQLDWIEANPLWRFRNPQEEGVDERTHLRL